MKKKVYDIIKKNHKNEFENNSFDTNKSNFESISHLCIPGGDNKYINIIVIKTYS